MRAPHRAKIIDNLRNLQHAPSVGIQGAFSPDLNWLCGGSVAYREAVAVDVDVHGCRGAAGLVRRVG